MRKLTSILLALAMLLSLAAVTAAAAGFEILFTPSSNPKTGYTMTIDKEAMLKSGSITSDYYNALLEGNVLVDWFMGDTLIQEGSLKNTSTLTLTADHANQTVRVKMTFYTDSSYTDACGSVEHTFTVQSFLPVINNADLPDAHVGDDYFVQLDCQDHNAEFSEFMGSQLSEFGLELTKDGKIKGTLSKVGNCHVNIRVVGVGGEDSVSYDITVSERDFEPYLELLETPKKTEYVVGETFDPTGMKVRIYTFDGSYFLSENGQYLDYYKEPLESTGEVKIKLSNVDLFTFVIINVKPAPAPDASTPDDAPDATTPDVSVPDVSIPTTGEDISLQPQDPGDSGSSWWIYVLVAVGAAALGAGAALLLLKRKK